MAQDLHAETGVALAPFGDRVSEAVERKHSQLVVGLDPALDLLPVEVRGDAHLGRDHAADAVARFCRGIVDAVAPYAVGVKPQLAFFEALGSDGMRAFEDVCAYARSAGLLVIADGKRGDIGSTARAYASAYLEPRAEHSVRESGLAEGVRGNREAPPVDRVFPPLADAATVNPYMGHDAVAPFLAACRRHGGGVFAIVKTSGCRARA
jgi:orotidine-5'-phosphate decarboxylase